MCEGRWGDTEFLLKMIAQQRTALPKLLAELRRLRTENAKMQEVIANTPLTALPDVRSLPGWQKETP